MITIVGFVLWHGKSAQKHKNCGSLEKLLAPDKMAIASVVDVFLSKVGMGVIPAVFILGLYQRNRYWNEIDDLRLNCRQDKAICTCVNCKLYEINWKRDIFTVWGKYKHERHYIHRRQQKVIPGIGLGGYMRDGYFIHRDKDSWFALGRLPGRRAVQAGHPS